MKEILFAYCKEIKLFEKNIVFTLICKVTEVFTFKFKFNGLKSAKAKLFGTLF